MKSVFPGLTMPGGSVIDEPRTQLTRGGYYDYENQEWVSKGRTDVMAGTPSWDEVEPSKRLGKGAEGALFGAIPGVVGGVVAGVVKRSVWPFLGVIAATALAGGSMGWMMSGGPPQGSVDADDAPRMFGVHPQAARYARTVLGIDATRTVSNVTESFMQTFDRDGDDEIDIVSEGAIRRWNADAFLTAADIDADGVATRQEVAAMMREVANESREVVPSSGDPDDTPFTFVLSDVMNDLELNEVLGHRSLSTD